MNEEMRLESSPMDVPLILKERLMGVLATLTLMWLQLCFELAVADKKEYRSACYQQ